MARSRTIRAAITIPLFFLLNISLSLLNRYALGHLGFTFPLVLTAFHALFGFLFLLPAVYASEDRRHRYMTAIAREWKSVALVGFWLALNIALNNLSLVYISLSLNQVIRRVADGRTFSLTNIFTVYPYLFRTYRAAFIPINHSASGAGFHFIFFLPLSLFNSLLLTSIPHIIFPPPRPSRRASIPLVTAIVSSATDRRLPRRGEFLGLVILCLGVSTAIGEATASGDSLGVMLCVVSVFAGAAMLTATSRALQGRIDSVQLMFFAAPVTCMCLVPPIFLREQQVFAEYASTRPGPAAMIVLSTSVLAGMYNVVHNDLVKITDPVTTCVLGQLKIVALMVLSALILGEGKDFNQRMSVGCAAAILGFSIYSWAKIKTIPGGSAQPRTPARSSARAKRPRPLMVVDIGKGTANADATPEVSLPGLRTPGSRGSRASTMRSNDSGTRRRSASSRKTPSRFV
jgi:hypothetical protein